MLENFIYIILANRNLHKCQAVQYMFLRLATASKTLRALLRNAYKLHDIEYAYQNNMYYDIILHNKHNYILRNYGSSYRNINIKFLQHSLVSQKTLLGYIWLLYETGQISIIMQITANRTPVVNDDLPRKLCILLNIRRKKRTDAIKWFTHN